MSGFFTRVVFVGGPDVDARIPLMLLLRPHFNFVAVGSNTELKDKFSSKGFDYYTYPLNRSINPLADIQTFIRLTSTIQRIKPHIVHTFDTKPGVWGRLAAKIAKTPIIIGTLPGLGSLYSTKKFYARMVKMLYEPLQKYASNVSDITIFQNQTDLQDFVRQGIVRSESAWVIAGSGVDTNVFKPTVGSLEETNRLRNDLGIPKDALVVTMIGRIIRSKGVMEFVDAARYITSIHPHVKFLLVGSVDSGNYDQLTATEFNFLQRNVIWLGYRSDIKNILEVSNIFVLPTYYREGIPRVLLEAASIGLPIITTDTPGCNDIVHDKVNGFLISSRDTEALVNSLEKLVVDTNLRNELGKSSRQRAVEHFDITVIAEQTRLLYLQLLAQKGVFM